MRTLEELRARSPRLAVGLMSGTSCDGVDVAYVLVSRSRSTLDVVLEGFFEFPFDRDFRDRLLALAEVESCRIDHICTMNFELAHRYVQAILEAGDALGIPPSDIDLIGSHGQTIHHLPDQAATLQIGEPAVLAEAFRVPVVADFRPKDIAAGGQGAPLVPYVDYVLLRHPQLGRIVQNIGGIANVTYLPPNCRPQQVLAFDTGPGNMVIDGVVQELTRGAECFDRDGRMAAKGRADAALVETLLEHPFFKKTPPKSTGREMFGRAYLDFFLKQCRERKLSNEDTVATATALTAESIVRAYERYIFTVGPVDEAILSGGGAANPCLVRRLHERLGIPVRLSSDLGLPPEAKEAVCFALLADETIEGRPNNLPAATGASRPVILGKITLPG